MASLLRSFIDKGKDFDFEKETLRLNSLENGKIMVLKDFNIFYSDNYGVAFVVIEDENGNAYSTFSNAIVDEFTRAFQMRLEGRMRGRIVKVVTKETVDGERTYQVLEPCNPEEQNDFQVKLIEKRKQAKLEREALEKEE